MLEFAYIARPWVVKQRFFGCRTETAPCAALIRGLRVYHLRGQPQNVFLALTQRRHVQIDHMDAIVQILAELADLDHVFEIFVRGANEVDIDRDGNFTAHPDHLAILNRAQ